MHTNDTTADRKRATVTTALPTVVNKMLKASEHNQVQAFHYLNKAFFQTTCTHIDFLKLQKLKITIFMERSPS